MKHGHILMASDLTRGCRAAHPHAASLAGFLDAEVTLVHVDDSVREAPDLSNVYREAHAHFRQGRIDQASEDFQAMEVPLRTEVISGRPRSALVDWVKAHHVDLVVMSRHSGETGQGRWSLGSTCYRVIQLSHVPVLVVPVDDAHLEPDAPVGPVVSYHRVLVAVDFSELSREGVRVAFDFARRLGAAVEVLHVVPLPRVPPTFYPGLDPAEVARQTQAQEADARRRIEAFLPNHEDLDVTPVVVSGERPSVAIRERIEATGVDLVIITRTGKGRMARLLVGSTTKRLLQHSAAPVLVLPEEILAVPHLEAAWHTT